MSNAQTSSIPVQERARDITCPPSKRTPSTGSKPGVTKRGYLLKPAGSSDGYRCVDGVRVPVGKGDEVQSLR
jgi:hypothetical protein